MDDKGKTDNSTNTNTSKPTNNPLQNYRFSEEELRVLDECNRESFFHRCLPLSTFFAAGTFYSIQRGYLKPNQRFGPAPKVILAAIIGYFLGKFSYQQKCAEKLMALPGSYIGQLLRERQNRRGDFMQTPNMGVFGVTPKDIYSDAGPESSLDLDTDRPAFTTDDTFKPAMDGTVPEINESFAKSKNQMSYEELRKKNREEYMSSRKTPYKLDDPPPPISRPKPGTSDVSKNRYGDEVD